MGSASSIVLQPMTKQILITLQTPNILALMDRDGPNGVAYKLIYDEWKSEIESVENNHYVNVFRLNDRPFSAPLIPLIQLGKAHIVSAAKARKSICELLEKFDKLGIKLITSVHIGKMLSRTTLFFERPDALPLNSDEHKTSSSYLCVSIRAKNILQFPMTLSMGKIHLDWIRNEFSSHLVSEENAGDYIEFTFKGQPFGNTGSSRYEEMIMSKRLFLTLVRNFSNNGYEFAAGLSIRGGYKNDTMIFKSTQIKPAKEINYFFISAEEKNRLRLFEAPSSAVEAVKSSIPSGNIKEVKPSYMGCVEIVFNNSPFDTSGKELADTQLQFLEIIDRLWQIGWELKGTVQCSLGNYDKSTLLFETSKEIARPIFGIALAKSDTIKMFKINPNSKTLIRELIISMWSKGIQNEYDITCGYAIKLKGKPFGGRDTCTDSHQGLHLIACLIEKLKNIGWHLHTSMDLGAKLINDEESFSYSPDGYIMVFVRERLSKTNSDQARI